MLDWEAELPGMHINSDWSHSISLSIISNDPEVGNPIRRLRSGNVKHILSCSMTLDYAEFQVFSNFINRKLHGGLDPFLFRSFLDGKSYESVLVIDGDAPFTSKRNSDTDYTVSFTISYIEYGGALDA